MRLSDFPQVIFKTTTTSHGNMSFTKGDPKIAEKNRLKFFKEENINPDDVKFMHLDLKDNVIVVDKNSSTDLEKADAAITQDKNLFLFMLTADCLPIALFDPGSESFALIHAGWQGLDLEIIKKTVNRMQNAFNTNPKDLIAKIGPSICSSCYTLLPGDHPLIKKYSDDKRWGKYIKVTETSVAEQLLSRTEILRLPSVAQDDMSYSIDLWSSAKDQLLAVGLVEENIENEKKCTYHSGKYFSHRKFSAEKLEYDYHIATVLGIRFS